jgi:hypothetical protein
VVKQTEEDLQARMRNVCSGWAILSIDVNMDGGRATFDGWTISELCEIW